MWSSILIRMRASTTITILLLAISEVTGLLSTCALTNQKIGNQYLLSSNHHLSFTRNGGWRSSPCSSVTTVSSVVNVPKKKKKRQHQLQLSSTTPKEEEDATDNASNESSATTYPLDVGALLRYIGAIGFEMTCFTLLSKGLDMIASSPKILSSISTIPLPMVWILMGLVSLKSRVFNPLDNSRPNRSKSMKGESSKGFNDRIMPKLTPPGIVFPIVWILVNTPLRATSAMLIYKTTGKWFSAPLLYFFLHLSIGDVWNTINNIERRMGTSVMGVLAVLASALWASYNYYLSDRIAGTLLGITCVWLTIASTLVIRTWQLNPTSKGKLDKLYPVKSSTIKTKFVFE